MKKPQIKDAGAEYTEIWGETIHTNRHLRVISVGLAIAVLLLILVVYRIVSVEPPRPIVVRVDEVGRAEAVAYKVMEAKADPLDPTTKYFLNRHRGGGPRSHRTGPAVYASSAPHSPMPRFAARAKMSPFSRRAWRGENCKSPASF